MCQVIPFTLPCCQRVYVSISKLPSCPEAWPRAKCPPELCIQVRGIEPDVRSSGRCWRCKAAVAGRVGAERERLRPAIDRARVVQGLEELGIGGRRRLVEAGGHCWFCNAKGGCPECGANEISAEDQQASRQDSEETPTKKRLRREREQERGARSGQDRVANKRIKLERHEGPLSTPKSTYSELDPVASVSMAMSMSMAMSNNSAYAHLHPHPPQHHRTSYPDPTPVSALATAPGTDASGYVENTFGSWQSHSRANSPYDIYGASPSRTHGTHSIHNTLTPPAHYASTHTPLNQPPIPAHPFEPWQPGHEQYSPVYPAHSPPAPQTAGTPTYTSVHQSAIHQYAGELNDHFIDPSLQLRDPHGEASSIPSSASHAAGTIQFHDNYEEVDQTGTYNIEDLYHDERQHDGLHSLRDADD